MPVHLAPWATGRSSRWRNRCVPAAWMQARDTLLLYYSTHTCLNTNSCKLFNLNVCVGVDIWKTSIGWKNRCWRKDRKDSRPEWFLKKNQNAIWFHVQRIFFLTNGSNTLFCITINNIRFIINKYFGLRSIEANELSWREHESGNHKSYPTILQTNCWRYHDCIHFPCFKNDI